MLVPQQPAVTKRPAVTDEFQLGPEQPSSKVKVDIFSFSSLKSIVHPFFLFFLLFSLGFCREQLSLSLITTRTRRFSCSSNSNGPNSGIVSPGPRLAPRITQLRQEECIDIHNREAQSEREIHSALSISQSYEDLTLVLNENCFFKNSEEFSNPLHVTLPSQSLCPSSPSPTRFVSREFELLCTIVDVLAGSSHSEGCSRSCECDSILAKSTFGENSLKHFRPETSSAQSVPI